jgi:hypothetical protein
MRELHGYHGEHRRHARDAHAPADNSASRPRDAPGHAARDAIKPWILTNPEARKAARAAYARRRDELCPAPSTSRFFVSCAGTPVHRQAVQHARVTNADLGDSPVPVHQPAGGPRRRPRKLCQQGLTTRPTLSNQAS